MAGDSQGVVGTVTLGPDFLGGRRGRLLEAERFIWDTRQAVGFHREARWTEVMEQSLGRNCRKLHSTYLIASELGTAVPVSSVT